MQQEPDYPNLIRNLVQTFNERRWSRLNELVNASCTVENLPAGKSYKGIEGYQAYSEAWVNAFPDGKMETRRFIGQGNLVCHEFIGRGTQTGAMEAGGQILQPTGKRVELPFCELLELSNGKVSNYRIYYDSGAMLRQLGLNR